MTSVRESGQNPPKDPFSLSDDWDFVAHARRSMLLHGQEVQLLYLPERRQRRGIPGPEKPPFLASPVERILAEEGLWSGRRVTITKNRYPFTGKQLLLWSQAAEREASLELLELGFAMAEDCGGSLLLNSCGAAASISRAHLHLIEDSRCFLGGLASEPVELAEIDGGPKVECRQLADPFPGYILELIGPHAERAKLAHRLLAIRSSPAVNLISTGGRCWIIPRSTVEIPAPQFPYALGAAELFGLWCFGDHQAYEEARPEDLEAALASCCLRR